MSVVGAVDPGSGVVEAEVETSVTGGDTLTPPSIAGASRLSVPILFALVGGLRPFQCSD